MKYVFLIIGLLSLGACIYGVAFKNSGLTEILSSGLFAAIFLFGYYQIGQGNKFFGE